MPRLTQADKSKLIEALGYAIQWERWYADAVAESDPAMVTNSRENIKSYRKLISKLKELSGVSTAATPSANYEIITVTELMQRKRDDGTLSEAVQL